MQNSKELENALESWANKHNFSLVIANVDTKDSPVTLGFGEEPYILAINNKQKTYTLAGIKRRQKYELSEEAEQEFRKIIKDYLGGVKDVEKN